MSANAESVSNQGEFHSGIAPSKPMQSGGTKNKKHKTGVHASPNDRIPEFSAHTLPPGTAPKSATYQPNPDISNQGYQEASETGIQGADSRDLHRGLGHPGQGQSSAETRHDGQSHRKKQGLGLAGKATVEDTGPGQPGARR